MNNNDIPLRAEVRRLTFSYDGKNPVLHDISLPVKEKRITALIGPSGCGKTTLLR
ncbi:MAG: ATP-binding cassette domain-containing protein, partial [Bdellovibrionaceae bacterium]|nr:ATP-binding cassette domain-containing protein [Pseudobdellovibrionaceae bacterium]